MTALIMKESECKSVWAYPVMHKGAANEPWVVKQILHDIDTIGLSKERIIMKNDQEPAIKDLRSEIARQRNAATAADESRVGDSNSNATIEVAVQEVENMTRTLRSSLQSKLGSKIKLEHLIVPWLIRHAAANITRFKVRANGKTAFQLMKGYKGVMPIGEFGECVHFRQPKAIETVGKYEDRWQGGVYLGFDMRSGEYIVGTEDGVYRSGAVRRRPIDERWSRPIIDGIKGDPEDYMRRPPTYTKKESADGEAVPKAVFAHVEPPEAQTRTFRISKEDVSEYGSTAGCAGCRAVVNRTETRNHSKTCRERFEKVLGETDKGKERIQRAVQRMDEAVAKEGEKIMNNLKDKKRLIEDAGNDMSTEVEASGVNRKRAAEDPPDDPNIIQEGEDQGPTTVHDDAADYSPTSPAKSENVMIDSPTISYKSDMPDDAEMDSVDKGLHSCGDCKGGFVSRNALFKHLRRMKHFSGSDREWHPSTDDGSQGRNYKNQEGHGPSSDPNPKPIGELGKENRPSGELTWKYIGTGVYARTFLAAKRLITTTRKGPFMGDVATRVVRDAKTGKVIDESVVEDTPDDVLHRQMPYPRDIRVELTMRKAQNMFEESGADISEIDSPPIIVQEATMQSYHGMKLRPGWSLDLTRNDPKTLKPWDFSVADCRERAMTLVKKSKPFMLIGSPPCTAFSILQNINKNRRPAEVIAKEIAAGRQHLRFTMKLYEEQAKSGRYFLHEHPNSASSWATEEVLYMSTMPTVEMAVCHMCRFGMTSERGS